MEVKMLRNVDGTAIQLRFGVWKCLICGETYLGTEATTHCPYCGAHAEHLVNPEAFPADINGVRAGLTESERRDLRESIDTEMYNARYYNGMAKIKQHPAYLCGVYKRLASIEAEHCGIFCKLLGVSKPDVKAPMEIKDEWVSNIRESLSREERAHEQYAMFGSRATSPRLRQVWTALAAVELDHIVLESTQLLMLPQPSSTAQLAQAAQ
eukprot:m51a1_g8390 hypothetical protein (210) ;mRNA; f:209072-209991